MGEAKRRKLLDPSYGKQRISMEVNTPGIVDNSKMLPDFGEHYFQQHGRSPLQLLITNPSVMCVGSDGYLHFIAGDYMGTILTSVSIALKYKNRQFAGVIRPAPNDRYFTQVTNEWVLPFRIDEEFE